MFSFLHKSVLQARLACFESVSLTKNSGFISSLSRRFFSTSTASDDDSFVVSYLIESCGLSRDSALNASKYIKFKSPDNPDRVLAFFKSHGFSDAQISKVVKHYPGVLYYIPEKTLLPKFQYLYSKGISETELAHMASASPRILCRSLNDYYIPLFNFYENLIGSEKKAVITFKRALSVHIFHSKTDVPLAMDVLRSYGVPDSNIAMLLQFQPGVLSKKADVVKKTAEELKVMGFDPQKTQFIQGFHVMSCLSKATWERKVSVYGKWGWSKEAVIAAFRQYPACISASEEKINAVMDHCVNKLGCESLVLAKIPVIFGYNLEKRVIPRTLLIKFLLEKGLLTKKRSLIGPLQLSEERFLQRYVYNYKEEAPELLKLYERLRASVPQGL